MRSIRPRPAALAALLLAAGTLGALAACDPRPGRTGGAAGAAADSLAMLATKLKDAEQASHDREAIALELAQTTKLLEEIDGEVTKVKGLTAVARKPDLARGARPAGATGADDPWVARHDSLLGKVRGVAALLARSRARVDELSRKNASQSKEMATYRETIASLETISKRQETEIAALTQAVDSLREANGRLATDLDGERAVTRGLRDTASAVYYVVGTKDELVKRGIVSVEGRKRFLVFGDRGLVPARRLNRAAFTRADMRQPLEIPLHANAKFHVISRHDASLLDVEPDAGAPKVKVAKPEEFWAPSRYLIIVTEG